MTLKIERSTICGGIVGFCSLVGKKKLNLLDDEVLAQATTDLRNIIKIKELRLIILQGKSSYSFSGGVNLNALRKINQNNAKNFINKLHLFCNMIRELDVPIIAKLQGFCIGGGLEIAAACDFRIGDYSIKCGMPEVKVGVPSVIEANLLFGLLGWGKARELILRGNIMDAEECLRIGLVQHLIDEKHITSFVNEICSEIISNGPNAIRLQKRLMLEWEQAMISNSISASMNFFQENFRTKECSDFVSRFFDKKNISN